MTAFLVTSRVVTVAFPKGAPDLTGEKGLTLSPSFARVIDPGKDGRVEVTGYKRREAGDLTAVVFTDSLPLAGPIPEWLDAILDLALLGENE